MSEKSSAIITVSSKGQIAIPKEFRVAVGLEAGSRVLIEYHKKHHTLSLSPVQQSMQSIFGIGKQDKKQQSNISDDDAISGLVEKEDNRTKQS